jgi:ABC-type microcin C transport system duplicated ATPase subunit YejF
MPVSAWGFPHQLSGGERQRVMIAMALLTRPELLIADEPTTALDVTVQAQILTLLRELRQELNMGLLFITHNLSIVRKLADNVAVMQNGLCVEQNSASALFAAPSHPYTRRLLNSEPAGDPVPLDPDTPRYCASKISASVFPSAKVSLNVWWAKIGWSIISASPARRRNAGAGRSRAPGKAPPGWRCCA